jgi:hypothetical protein
MTETHSPRRLSQGSRILIAVGIIAVLALVILGGEILRGRLITGAPAGPAPTLAPGGIPIYLDGRLIASFTPADLDQLTKASFIEPAENKPQEGWLLGDILRLHLKAGQLKPENQVIVSSSSRKKSAQLTWAEVADPANKVMFDLSNRGTLKLVSVLPKLDTREEWVQDTDRIEVTTP